MDTAFLFVESLTLLKHPSTAGNCHIMSCSPASLGLSALLNSRNMSTEPQNVDRGGIRRRAAPRKGPAGVHSDDAPDASTEAPSAAVASGSPPSELQLLFSTLLNPAMWILAVLVAVHAVVLACSWTLAAVSMFLSAGAAGQDKFGDSLTNDVAQLVQAHPIASTLSVCAIFCGIWALRRPLTAAARLLARLPVHVVHSCRAAARTLKWLASFKVRVPLIVVLNVWAYAAGHPLATGAAQHIWYLKDISRPMYVVSTWAAYATTLPWNWLGDGFTFMQRVNAIGATYPGIATPIIFVLVVGSFGMLRRSCANRQLSVARRTLARVANWIIFGCKLDMHVAPMGVALALCGLRGIMASLHAAYSFFFLTWPARLAWMVAAVAAWKLLIRLKTPLDGEQAVTGKLSTRPVVDDVTRLNATEVDRIWYVRCEEDVQHVIREARANGRHVSCRGQHHTMGAHTISAGGYVIDMAFLNFVEHDAGAGTVTCGPGATWGDLIRHLNRHGLSPRTMQSYCSFSVGGTIAVNAHGITTDYSMHESVISMRVVTADGDVITVDRDENNPDLFGRVIGGFGLFGIITSVTLKTAPNRKLNMEMIKLSAAEFPAVYHKCLADDSIDVKLARVDITNSKDIYLFLFRRASDEPTVSDIGPHAREMGLSTRMLYKWVMPLRLFQRMRYLVEDFTQQPLDWAGESDRNTLMHESAAPLAKLYNVFISVDDTFILQEYFVPDGGLQPWIARSRPILWAKHKHVTLLNITIRYVREDDATSLPYAPKDSYAFVLYYRLHRTAAGDAELASMHHQLVELTLDLGGTFYLPYRHHYTDEEMDAAYPSAASFFEAKQRYDPQNVFSNAWYRRYGARFIDVHRKPAPIEGAAPALLPPAEADLSEMELPVVANRRTDSYAKTFASPVLREKLVLFLENVFRVESPRVAYSLIAQCVWSPRNIDDFMVFRELCQRLRSRSMQTLLKLRNGYRQLRQLQQQVTDLSEQLEEILAELGVRRRRVIRDVLTMGDPGRLVLPLKRMLGVKGRVWVVHDKERGFTDAVERGSLGSVGRFVPIDYDNVAELPIPSNSVDLVTLSMGLHHFHQDQLSTVLAIIRRVLRPGGIFIVREHDARPDLLPICDLAHSVFNAVMGVSEEEEQREIRAFRPILEWRDVLTRAGFEDTYIYKVLPVHMDPTEDYMLAFVKPPFGRADGKLPEAAFDGGAAESKGEESRGDEEARPRSSTASSATPSSAPQLRRAVSDQTDEGARVERVCRSADDAIVESGQRPVRALHDSTWYKLPEWLLVTVAQEFGSSLDHTPWYRFPYLQFVALYWRVFDRELRVVAAADGLAAAVINSGAFMDFVIGVVLTLLFLQLKLLALGGLLAYGTSNQREFDQLIVEAPNEVDWESIDPRLKAVKVDAGSDSAHVWVLEVPNHAPFTQIIKKLAARSREVGARLLQISGWRGSMQLRVVAHTDEAVRSVGLVAAADTLFEYRLPRVRAGEATDEDETSASAGTHIAMRVNVEQLLSVVDAIETTVDDADVAQVYDFYGQ